MVSCPVCQESLDNTSLRTEFPKCPNDHVIGRWVSCANTFEKHVYLQYQNSDCPYCENKPAAGVPEGVHVKCLHVTTERSCLHNPAVRLDKGRAAVFHEPRVKDGARAVAHFFLRILGA